jgi:hypothetical protein
MRTVQNSGVIHNILNEERNCFQATNSSQIDDEYDGRNSNDVDNGNDNKQKNYNANAN